MIRIPQARLITTVAVLFLLTAPAAAGAYGAIATSPNAAFGYSNNYDDAQGASQRALEECRQQANNCTVKQVLSNTCVSIVKASNGAMGWAWGRGREEDLRLAMRDCQKNRGKDCTFAQRFCTGDP
jgi:serine/threonine-protein kinase